MARCKTCTTLTVEELRSHMTFFHPNLRSLRDSATAGCDLCMLCWVSIQRKYPTNSIDSVLDGRFPANYERAGQPLDDERVWLTGMFSDLFLFRNPKELDNTTGTDKTNNQAGSHVWVDCGSEADPEASVAKEILHSELSVFADPGTPAASQFIERLFAAFRNKDREVDFARVLLDGCQKRHPECRNTDENTSPEMPTRVLDIGDTPGWTRLVQPQQLELREPYLALSYCWGQGVRHTTELNDGNFTSLLELIDEDTLSATHKECIAIARQLGIRYIWIDSLCIIQGNLEDWMYESKRMAEVYGNATLTIIAGRAADSRTGFKVNNMEQIVPPCPIPSTEYSDGLHLWLPRRKEEGPVSTRGWCFQEKVLSRRALVYAKEQVYFSCQRSKLWEDGTLDVQDPSHLRIGLFPDPSEDIDAESKRSEQKQLRTWMLKQWYKEILPDYTLRRLTNPDDIFAASSSIVQLTRRSIRSRYLAGVWEADMVRGLLWCTSYSVKWILRISSWPKPIRPVDRDGQTVTRAPSWSWASVQGQIYTRPEYIRQDKSFQDPTNVLIRPSSSSSKSDSPNAAQTSAPSPRESTPGWTLLEDPNCDANILYMPICELAFFGRPKRARCTAATQSELAAFPRMGWPQRRLALAEQGFVALLQPSEAEHATLEELKLPTNQGFAITCFDIAEERAGVEDCWFLPVLKDRREGLLLRKDESDGKFRRLGLVVLVKEQFLPWLISGPEEEVHLV
ncbi:HET-domain-containing protein [Daldinia caldariorum]|uniref:HET-domain-containing protein n=1 Tax=Daldinia caldariorum TaxID=326644 RepID=UPI0020078534|nr:HET-domain-containing protein [Daldinia caldariorum]KAI1466432.1 HET-domain-containing protein [Daldinia caldariorum]